MDAALYLQQQQLELQITQNREAMKDRATMNSLLARLVERMS